MVDEPNTDVVDELEREDGIVEGEGGEGASAADKTEKKSDDWRAAMAELATTLKSSAPKKEDEEKPLTAEETAKLWAVYNPEESRKDFFQKFFRLNPDATTEEVAQAKELFSEMQKGLMRQAMVGSKNLLTIELEKIREEFNPIREYVSSQKAEATRGRFYKSYETLNDPKYEKIVEAVARTLTDKTFSNEGDYFKALAEGAAGAIKELVPDFELGKTKEKPKTGSTLRLPRTSAGGTGGAGSGARPEESGSKSRNDVDSLD